MKWQSQLINQSKVDPVGGDPISVYKLTTKCDVLVAARLYVCRDPVRGDPSVRLDDLSWWQQDRERMGLGITQSADGWTPPSK